MNSVWWSYLLRGLFALAFGLIAMFWTGTSLYFLVIAFAVYVLVDAAGDLGAAVSSRRTGHSWIMYLLLAILGIAAGIFALAAPAMTAVILALLIGTWGIAIGVTQIAIALSEPRATPGKWLGVAAGALPIVIGLLLLFRPVTSSVVLLWTIGLFACAYGITLIAAALGVRLAKAIGVLPAEPVLR